MKAIGLESSHTHSIPYPKALFKLDRPLNLYSSVFAQRKHVEISTSVSIVRKMENQSICQVSFRKRLGAECTAIARGNVDV